MPLYSVPLYFEADDLAAAIRQREALRALIEDSTQDDPVFSPAALDPSDEPVEIQFSSPKVELLSRTDVS